MSIRLRPRLPFKPTAMKTLLLYLLLLLVIGGHWVVVMMNVAAFILLPFVVPWYVASPLMSFIALITTTKVNCPLTRLENCIRKQLGLRLISTFIGHYLVKPFKMVLSNNG
ncbi:MAG: DUF2784 family protein [Nitrosomonadaceae bacterium]|nr:DUF2784 family protein [Nitrosomonadaceae bacterium]